MASIFTWMYRRGIHHRGLATMGNRWTVKMGLELVPLLVEYHPNIQSGLRGTCSEGPCRLYHIAVAGRYPDCVQAFETIRLYPCMCTPLTNAH
jgi:hypothetical protein